MVVGARQNFKFFRQNTWLPKNIGALFKFLYGILHYFIYIILIFLYCEKAHDNKIFSRENSKPQSRPAKVARMVNLKLAFMD